jgi:hypothetical protein
MLGFFLGASNPNEKLRRIYLHKRRVLSLQQSIPVLLRPFVSNAT